MKLSKIYTDAMNAHGRGRLDFASYITARYTFSVKQVRIISRMFAQWALAGFNPNCNKEKIK